VVCQKLNSIGKRYRVSRGCDGQQGGSPKCCKKLAHGSLFERLISEADVQIALRFRGLCRAVASGMSVATNRTPAFCKPSRNARRARAGSDILDHCCDRVEQAHGSALAHYVHRPSGLGSPVLINETR
jgi:hypothetical protein